VGRVSVEQQLLWTIQDHAGLPATTTDTTLHFQDHSGSQRPLWTTLDQTDLSEVWTTWTSLDHWGPLSWPGTILHHQKPLSITWTTLDHTALYHQGLPWTPGNMLDHHRKFCSTRNHCGPLWITRDHSAPPGAALDNRGRFCSPLPVIILDHRDHSFTTRNYSAPPETTLHGPLCTRETTVDQEGQLFATRDLSGAQGQLWTTRNDAETPGAMLYHPCGPLRTTRDNSGWQWPHSRLQGPLLINRRLLLEDN